MRDESPDDIALVHRIARGDREALAVLYQRYAPILLALGERIVGQRREAEDLLHDVFLETWRCAADYSEARGSVRTWLTLRLRSRAIDRVRSPRLRRGVSLDSAPAAAPEVVAPDNPHASAEHARVRAALASLATEHQAVLLLAYFEGLSSTEMADRLGLPVGTVKSRMAAARRGMLRALGGEEAL